MQKVYLGLGSNINRHHHLTDALERLSALFGELSVSSVYESAAVGFSGDPFLNLVVGFACEMPLAELLTQIKAIEDANGRDRSGPKFGPRTLDIDVLCYGDLTGSHDGIELPRAEILANAYVLLPLVEIAGAEILPGSERSYQSIWQSFDKSRQVLWRVEFSWRDRAISEPGPGP